MTTINGEGGINKLLYTLFAEELMSQKQSPTNEIVTHTLYNNSSVAGRTDRVNILMHLR